ncbi:unnamed protein product [Boreogadus saida]
MFKQVDCEFSLKDIRAPPANRMTRTVLSILVIFVCLAPILETLSSILDDRMKKIQVIELEFNSLKDYYNTRMDALAEEFKEIERELEASLAMLNQGRRPKFAASKNYLETLREWYSETKDKFLLFTEVFDKAYEFIHKGIEEVKDLVNETVNKDEL